MDGKTILKWISKFWSGNLKGRDHFGDLVTYEKVMLKLILGCRDGSLWTELVCVQMETSGRLL
jgi:hypothetical protein